MQRSHVILILRIHILTIGDKPFDDLLVTLFSRMIQDSDSMPILRIQIRTCSQVLLYNFNISCFGGFMN